jgi:hypothetical protein
VGLPSQHVADAAGVVRLSGQREMSDRGQPASPRGGAVVVSSKRADDVEDAGLLIDHDICRQHFKRRAACPSCRGTPIAAADRRSPHRVCA